MRTGPGECSDMLKRARAAFQAGRTANERFRLAQLDAVMRLVFEHECDFVDALGRDLHKVRNEHCRFAALHVIFSRVLTL